MKNKMTKKRAEAILNKRYMEMLEDSGDLLKAAKNYVEAFESGILPSHALDMLILAIARAEGK